MRITDIQDEGSIVVVWLGDNEDETRAHSPTSAPQFSRFTGNIVLHCAS
jgi:hypothetical protein